MDASHEWSARYDALARALPVGPDEAARFAAAPFLFGMNICVDARVDLSDPAAMAVLTGAPEGSPAHGLAREILARVGRGVGGEVRFDWAEGPDWLRGRMPFRPALGGTGPQAAAVLARLGAPAAIPLEDRTVPMLALIPPGVLIADGGAWVGAADVAPCRDPVAEIYIFEYTAGRPVAGVVPPRSSRIIVRFSDRGIQRDPAFEAMAARLAARAPAALVSGLNDEPVENVGAAGRHVFGLARSWREAGLATIHFELAGYVSQAVVAEALELARGAVTSLGMSHSELKAMDPTAEDPTAAMVALGDRLGLDRVCVHADGWAAAVTLGDPDVERDALMAGCLAASARAAAGMPVAAPAVDPRARFEALPFPERARLGRWNFVACASPYLDAPATTLGLGDSFTAGCLLVLGRAAIRAAAPA